MASIYTIPQWYPAPCSESGCPQGHRVLDDGTRFHQGVYIQIRGLHTHQICRTKIQDTGGIIECPRIVKKIPSPGSLSIRLLALDPRLKVEFFDYSTGLFPEFVNQVDSLNESAYKIQSFVNESLCPDLNQIISSYSAIAEQSLDEQIAVIWKDGVQLYESSKGT